MAYSTISKPSLHFNTKLYTGNSTGSTTQAITGVGFQPDWVWLKSRDTAERHWLVDAVRGITNGICSHTNEAQFSNISMVSFDNDGFTVGTDAYSINKNNDNYASWNWKAGNSAGSSNTDGDITATVSANTTAGFSIIKWSGVDRTGTIGHGLGAVPKMIIAKRLATRDWAVYHASVGANKKLVLNSTAAEASSTGFDDTPTSSVINVGYNDDVNGGGADYIAYCFAEKKGFSKFGSYIGNGNADGTFVYTGFSPSVVMTKRSDSTSDWLICDNKRPGYNVINKKLFANLSQAEDSYDSFDFLSNGFKIRSAGTGHNASSGTFIYMAFAEEPLVANVGSSIPATAR